MDVRKLTVHDIPAVARLHHEAIPDSPASLIGVPYLAKLYLWFIRQPMHEGLIAVDDGRVVGVITLTRDLTHSQSEFARGLRYITAFGMVRLLFTGRVRPSVLVERYRFERAIKTFPQPYATIQTLAVARNARRKGIGRRLVRRIGEGVHGSDELFVDTLRTNNIAQAFYTAAGFRKFRIVADSVVFVKKLH